MPATPLELTLAISPRARFDLIDVRDRVAETHREALDVYPRCLYCSFHTTAGYLEQSLASRLARRGRGARGYVQAFRTLFPERAGYRHDEMDQRTELSHDARQVEPHNGDSHLAFMAAGLSSVVSYRNPSPTPVTFIDLDGMMGGRPRLRSTSLVGYTREEDVARVHVSVPVSGHPMDSVNLKDPRLGLYEQLHDLVRLHGVEKGRLRLELTNGERQAGLTVNEYETLLMQHDLTEVLRDPLRFVAEKGRHVWADPRAVPMKTLGYAKYDFVRAFNEALDALGLSESFVERVIARAMAFPAARFLRMKRSISLFVSDRHDPGHGRITEGEYQSPILVQWRQADRRTRHLHVTLTRFT